MKKKFLALTLIFVLAFSLFMACKPIDDKKDSETESAPIVDTSIEDSVQEPEVLCPACGSTTETHAQCEYCGEYLCQGDHSECKPEPHYGLPELEMGYYMKDADVLDDGENRVLLYVTNGEQAEEDNVVATRTATYVEEKGWLYGEESIALVGEAGAWDEFIGSAALVKGEFEYGDVEYSWLMAYCATPNANDTQYEIGLAVATEIGGTWVKVGDRALIEFDEAVYGAGCVGCYAPSLVNLNGESAIRIYYTYADIYGHFAQFIDINASDLDALYTDAAKNDVNLMSGTCHVPTNGNLSGGDAELMFPNGDFAHCNGKVIAVKDYSPTGALTPSYAQKIELGYIAEAELYTAEIGYGWVSYKLWDFADTPDMAYERLYGACVVTNAYGHVAEEGALEIIYNVCDLEMDNEYWMFSQHLVTLVYERV